MPESKIELSGFWQRITKFHDSGVALADPSGQRGLEAIYFLLDTLGRDWEPDGGHPLRNKLSISSEPNYQWLVHFMVKLRELAQISGNEQVVSRLRNSKSYPGALSEMEFALRLRLGGQPCRFSPIGTQPLPDLVATLEDKEVDIEVTSLNPPREDAFWIEAIGTVQMRATQAHCVAGGLWSRVPAESELKTAAEKAQEAVDQATTEHKMINLNIPGLLTCYIAPDDLASEIPSEWRGSFVMRTKAPVPKKDRLANKIEQKAKRQLSRRKPSLLVIYDRFSSPDEMERLFDEKELELTVGSFTNLAGVILVYPFSSWDARPMSRKDKKGRTYLEYPVANGESERCVIWKNIMVDHQPVIEPVISCLTNSSAHFVKLFHENL